MCNCQSLPGPPLSCIARVNSYLVRFQNIKVLAVVEEIQNGCLLLPDQIAPYSESRRAWRRCLLLLRHAPGQQQEQQRTHTGPEHGLKHGREWRSIAEKQHLALGLWLLA